MTTGRPTTRVRAAACRCCNGRSACVWNWDARPFPTFPLDSAAWGDAGNWQAGDWTTGLRTALVPPVADPAAKPGTYPTFPALSVLGWSVNVTPRFVDRSRRACLGRESRAAARAWPLFDLELTYRGLAHGADASEFKPIAGFFAGDGRGGALLARAAGPRQRSQADDRNGDGSTTIFPLGRPSAATPSRSQDLRRLGGLSQRRSAGRGLDRHAGLSGGRLCRAAPPPGVAVTADFGALWLCRFAEDVADLENFMTMLWRWRSVKLQTVGRERPARVPSLAGQGWSVHKKPMFSTIVAAHVSGREVRDALYANPIWQFELTFDGLDLAGRAIPARAQSLQTLMGFFLQCQGQYGTFLYVDPTDNTAAARPSGPATDRPRRSPCRALGGFSSRLAG